MMSCAHTTPFDTPAFTAPDPGEVTGCQDCAEIGETVWSHLRMCLSCGHVACCDSSPHKHAAMHHKESAHPVMRSYEPGESWRWCYVDRRLV